MKASKVRQCLLDLKKRYTDEAHPLYLSGITQIYSHYGGVLSIKNIEDSQYNSNLYNTQTGKKNPYQEIPHLYTTNVISFNVILLRKVE